MLAPVPVIFFSWFQMGVNLEVDIEKLEFMLEIFMLPSYSAS